MLMSQNILWQYCFYDKYGFVKIKFQKLLVFEKNEKNVFFEKLGLQIRALFDYLYNSKPDCRGNRINSETFFFGFLSKIEFSTSLYKKKSNF